MTILIKHEVAILNQRVNSSIRRIKTLRVCSSKMNRIHQRVNSSIRRIKTSHSDITPCLNHQIRESIPASEGLRLYAQSRHKLFWVLIRESIPASEGLRPHHFHSHGD